MFSNDEQLKSFLKKESNRLGISITNTYNTYFSRLLLERISKMSYDKLYVKGSFSELCHLDKMIRPVTDIDIVSTVYHNDPLLVLYQAMYDSNNDNIVYELTDLPKRTKTGIYKLSLTANFGKIKHPISIDFQELSNTIYEKDLKLVQPIFQYDEPFKIYTPSYEEHFAEKLCIVLESNNPGVLNTRVKDFYDIYKLYKGKYDVDKLYYFFARMLEDRNKINIEDADISFLNTDYVIRHTPMWNNMKKKYEFLDDKVTFYDSACLTRLIIEDQLNNFENSKNLKIKLKENK